MSASKTIPEWIATLRQEYLEAKAANKRNGDSPAALAAALTKVLNRYRFAFGLFLDKEIRKTRDYFDLQVDEARVLL